MDSFRGNYYFVTPFNEERYLVHTLGVNWEESIFRFWQKEVHSPFFWKSNLRSLSIRLRPLFYFLLDRQKISFRKKKNRVRFQPTTTSFLFKRQQSSEDVFMFRATTTMTFSSLFFDEYKFWWTCSEELILSVKTTTHPFLFLWLLSERGVRDSESQFLWLSSELGALLDYLRLRMVKGPQLRQMKSEATRKRMLWI